MSIATQVTWFTPAQARLVIITERAASGLSVLGCLFVFITFAYSPRLRRPVNRILFYATIANLCMNVGTMLAFTPMYAGADSLLCQTQGFLIQMFLPTDVLWNIAMAINTYLTVFKNYDARRLRKLEWLYNLINFSVPFGVALVYCFVSTPSRGKVFGPAILWCWISEPWDLFRIATCYGPVWVAIVVCILIYLAAGVSIFRKRNQLREFRHRSKHVGGASSLVLSFLPNSINRTTEVQTTSVMRDTDSDEKILTAGQYQCSAEALPKNPFSEGNHLHHSQNPAMEANAAAWGYTKAAMLFFTCLVITWGPSSVFRVFSVLHPEIHNFPIAYTSAVVLPLQGFWNAIIYIIVSWDGFKAWIREDMRSDRSSTSPHWVDTKSTFSHAGTLQGNRVSAEGIQSPISDGLQSPEGKHDAFESLYGMTSTGTPKLPPIGYRSQSSLGLNGRSSFDQVLSDQRFNRSASVRSARNTSDSNFDRSHSVRSARQGSNRRRPASSQGRRPPSIEERPGTAPELFRPLDVEFGPSKIEGLVELPTAITPRAPQSPSPP